MIAPQEIRVTSRSLALLVLASALAVPVGARSLVDRLPTDAAIIGSIDLEAVRKSALAAGRVESAPVPEQAESLDATLRAAGIDLRKDIAQVAFGILPSKGDGQDDVAMIASGNLDPEKLKAAVLKSGAVPAKVGDVAAWRLPRSAGDTGAPAFLSFVDGLTVIGSEGATKAVHARTAGAAEVSRKPAEIPGDATFWLAGDLGRVHPPAGGGQVLGNIQRIQLWGKVTDALDLHAIADAADAQVAQQIAGLAGLAAGFAGGSDPSLGSALSGLSVAAKDRRITAGLTLTKAQLDALAAAKATDAEAPADAKKPAPAAESKGGGGGGKAAPGGKP